MLNKAKQIFEKDYYRNTNGKKFHFYSYFVMGKKMRMLFWFRKCNNSKGIFYFFNRIIYSHYLKWNNNEIPAKTSIGEGLYLGHSGGRYINSNCIIGRNCNLNHNVTIGQENRGIRKGSPTIGNQVWVGANAVIVGNISIGNNVLIAPNSFVNFDVPSDSIVIGNPAKIIKDEFATKDYICDIV